MSNQRRKGSLLGVLAYALVPGERRVQAAKHFRRAGFEALKGVGALMRPQGPDEPKETARRERIEIE
jgi:hypothetical protein